LRPLFSRFSNPTLFCSFRRRAFSSLVCLREFFFVTLPLSAATNTPFPPSSKIFFLFLGCDFSCKATNTPDSAPSSFFNPQHSLLNPLRLCCFVTFSLIIPPTPDDFLLMARPYGRTFFPQPKIDDRIFQKGEHSFTDFPRNFMLSFQPRTTP